MEGQNYKALLLTKAKTFEIQEKKARSLQAHEVRVKLGAAGICGTDMHYYQSFENAGFKLQSPLVLGHEASGIIVELGADVTGLSVGDKVAITPVMNCGYCSFCKKGQSHICLHKKFPGSATTIPHIDGYFREYFEVEARCCRKLPSDSCLDYISLTEPAACSLHSLQRAGNVMGKNILLTGAGPIGTLAAALAKHNGANLVALTDLADEPLTIAKKMKVDYCLNVKKDSLENFVKSHGEFDIAIEASGSSQAYLESVEYVRKKGSVIQLSVQANPNPAFPVNKIMLKELDIKGSFQFTYEFEMALKLIQSGQFDVSPMITHKFTFENAAEAFSIAADRSKSMKVIFSHS